MKKYLFFVLSTLFLLATASAQRINNLVVFCNDGEKFTLILNGEKYNTSPLTTVTATDLPLASYQARVIFENSKIKDLNTTVTFSEQIKNVCSDSTGMARNIPWTMLVIRIYNM